MVGPISCQSTNLEIVSRMCTYAELAIAVRVGTSGVLKDVLGHVIKIMRGVGVVVAFGESVDEDARVW